MRISIIPAAALSLVLAAALTPAYSAEAKSQHTAQDLKNAKPTATIELDATQVSLLAGGASGKGVLTFQGKQYPFTMKAVSAGSVGVSKVQATGSVYFLNKVEDFPGTYSAVGAAITVGAGVGANQYENSKGVLVSVRSKSEGVALTLGIGGIEIALAK